jgi:hypothetical protein
MKSLPTEIIHYILSFDERWKIRNGKYMYQIPKTDIRYEMLKKIPQPGLFRSRIYSTESIVILNFYYTLFKLVSRNRNQILYKTKVAHKRYYHNDVIVT